ncbi:MAG: hypothetical protein ACPHCI_07685, partial [Solirubrobacterales bacterium]
ILQDVSAELAPAGLDNPHLLVLETDPALVKFLLFQPQGVVVGDADHVGVRDRDILTLQMKGFLRKARASRADVALCPEYSCTWPALLESVEQNVFPEDGRLWVIACEGATQGVLEDAIARFRAAGLKVVFDESVWNSNGNFVDALCYLFRTRLIDGPTVGTILVQPKTHPMGGMQFEYQHLKTADKIFRFRNTGGGSGNLVAFICSDTLHPQFSTDIAPHLKEDTFVLHPQMNTNPSSPGFCAYRLACCGHWPRTTEILTLNWAEGTQLLESGQLKPYIVEPKSIWFRDVRKACDDDDTVMANHSKGLYLTHWNKHTAAYVLSPDPGVFLLQTTKPFVRGPATNAMRDGPAVLELLGWNEESSTWEEAQADDRFRATWHDPHPEVQPIIGPMLPQRLLDAERLIQLSVGEAQDIEWVDWKRQPAFQLAGDDTPHRLTLCWSNRGLGGTYRTQCLSKFRGFASAVSEPARFSIRLSEFRSGGFTVDHRSEKISQRLRNLYKDNVSPATAIFAGLAPPQHVLHEVQKKTIKALEQTDADVQKLAIWYREPGGELKDFMDRTIPQANDDPGAGAVDFDNTSL